MIRGTLRAISRCRPRFVTLLVLIVVAAPIAVANLNHAPRPPRSWPPPIQAYGWPLIWYWCEFDTGTLAARTEPELVEWSRPGLGVNLAAWLVIFAAVAAASEWLLRRYASSRPHRPRILTLVVLTLVAAPVVLANLSGDGIRTPSYGWPLVWRWRDGVPTGYGAVMQLDQNYSPLRLTGNLGMWLVMLGTTGIGCEWLLRRYRPRFRWSLRTMLAGMALACACCAWCVALRDRADKQDAVISVADDSNGLYELYVERWGPKWLDVVGADRFRRRVIGAQIGGYSDDDDEKFLKSLGRLPALRYLELGVLQTTPEVGATLARLSQLRTLRIDEIRHEEGTSQEYLAGIGKLSHLEEFHLQGSADSRILAYLAGLTNLKTLSLQIDTRLDGADPDGSDNPIPFLAKLPVLPRLEAVNLGSTWGGATICDRDLPYLAAQPRLESLNLSDGDFTTAGLAELSSLKTLEELAIGGDLATPAGIEYLPAIKRLKALHMERYVPVTDETVAALSSPEWLEQHKSDGGAMYDWERRLIWAIRRLRELHAAPDGSADDSDRVTTVPLDRGDRILALESEVDGIRRALDALRQAHPGIVIDSDPKWFDPDRGRLRRDSPWGF